MKSSYLFGMKETSLLIWLNLSWKLLTRLRDNVQRIYLVSTDKGFTYKITISCQYKIPSYNSPYPLVLINTNGTFGEDRW